MLLAVLPRRHAHYSPELPVHVVDRVKAYPCCRLGYRIICIAQQYLHFFQSLSEQLLRDGTPQRLTKSVRQLPAFDSGYFRNLVYGKVDIDMVPDVAQDIGNQPVGRGKNIRES